MTDNSDRGKKYGFRDVVLYRYLLRGKDFIVLPRMCSGIRSVSSYNGNGIWLKQVEIPVGEADKIKEESEYYKYFYTMANVVGFVSPATKRRRIAILCSEPYLINKGRI